MLFNTIIVRFLDILTKNMNIAVFCFDLQPHVTGCPHVITLSSDGL